MRASSVACVALAWSAGCSPEVPPSMGHPLEQRAAPSFAAVATNGREVGVPAADRTRVTVVDFWASWCPLCRDTLPSFSELYDDRRADGVLVIAVSIDEQATPAAAFLASIDAQFPLVMDSGQRLATTFGVGSVPMTFVVDEGGRVRWVGRDPELARDAAEALLREEPHGSSQTFY